MRLNDVLKRDNVHVFLHQTEKEPLLAEMVDLLLADRSEADRQETLRQVMLREQIGSTGIGDGVAVPHANPGFTTDLMACLGIAENPVSFDAIDGQPVRILVLVLGPRGLSGRHLRFLARVARLLKKEQRRNALLACTDADQAFRVLEEFEEGQIDA